MEGGYIDGGYLVASLVDVELIRSHVLIGKGCLFIWFDWLASSLFSGCIFSGSSSFFNNKHSRASFKTLPNTAHRSHCFFFSFFRLKTSAAASIAVASASTSAYYAAASCCQLLHTHKTTPNDFESEHAG